MERNKITELIELLEEKRRREKTRKLFEYYPDTGPLRRELYVKHMEFFAAGATKRERLAMAANRVGKTEGIGGYELTLHLTGKYPAWWTGKRFNRPITAWAAGDTGKTVRDIIQKKLLGPYHNIGTGLIPGDLIEKITPKLGVAEAVDTIYVRHVAGGLSQLTLKSYDQKRHSFQGTEIDVGWLDEEPPIEIYTETLMRTMTTKGILMLTFTPLMGMSETVLAFLPGGQLRPIESGSKYVVMATWDDAPHLSQEEKDEMWNSIPPFQRDARSKGIPALGSGAIYPVPETDLMVNDFEIPDHWPRGFSMDVGWNRTAGGLYTMNKETDVLYKYGEHYRGEAEPSIHAESIKSAGRSAGFPDGRIPGVMDPAARGRSQIDGRQLLQIYKDLGLDVEVASNAVEAGIYELWQRMSTGRFKVFKSCQNFWFEFRLYRRDDKGRIIKENDHAMDETRYFVMGGIERMKIGPKKKKDPTFGSFNSGGGSTGWMGS